MTIRKLFGVALAAAMLLFVSEIAQAQSGPVMLKAPPPGQTEFPACCKWCPPSGCTECNSGPEGLNCGPGLIKAECSMKDNVVHCEKDTARPTGTSPTKLKSN